MGRYKDLIIYDGNNIYPDQVEEVIAKMEGILESAVIGIPHPVFGEVPRAYVVKDKQSNLTEADIIRHCRERLANYKVPEIHFMSELPKNRLGKVLKRLLKQQNF